MIYFCNCCTLSLHQINGSLNPIIRDAAKAAPSSSRTVTQPRPSQNLFANQIALEVVSHVRDTYIYIYININTMFFITGGNV